MKHLFISLTLFLTLFCTLFAQSFPGEYFVAATGGEIVLTLQHAGQNQLTGKLVDTNGAQYQLQGTYEADDASGTITNAQGGLYFKAYLDGQQLILTLIPPAANQQPDYAKAQEFPMTRRGNGMNNAGKMSGPLGNAGGPAQGWSGTYNGNISGTPAIMTLQQNGNQLNGQIDAGGYIYILKGTANDNKSEGQVTDPQTQGVMAYQGTLDDTKIDLVLSANGAQLQLQFSKGGNPGTSGQPFSQGSNAGTANSEQLDQRLVGNWLYSESYTSDGFSFASQWRMIVNADGTYLYGDAKVAGGGGGVTGSSGGGEMTRSKWKTENGIIYIDEGYGWQPYAKYYLEGNSLMLTLGDGKRQVWKR